MKKIKFLSALALTMVMASCDNFDLPNPPGQTNPEPDGYFEASGLVLTQGDANVNLVEANKANEFVTVANVEELVNFPADYDLSIDMQVSGDANFSKVATIGTTIEGKAVTVNPDILNGAIQEAMTKQPGTYDIYTRYIAYAERQNTRMRLGGLNAFYGTGFEYNVVTLDPAKVLEQSYYFVPCNASGVPQVSKAVKMNNTSGDNSVSVYDNPEFAVKFDVTEAESLAGYKWVVLPQSAVTAGNIDGMLGCIPSADSDLRGKLTAGAEAGVINIMGSILCTINVEVESYSLNYAFDVLYPYANNGLKEDQLMCLYTTNYINYSGVTTVKKQFTLGTVPNSKNSTVNFGNSSSVEQEISEDGLTRKGELVSGNKVSAIKAVEGADLHLMWTNLNLVQLTYELVILDKLSVVGKHNDWNEKEAPAMTPSADKRVWEAKGLKLGGDFKINANSAWAVSFSGSKVADTTGELVYNVNKQDGGENLSCPEGSYDVKLDFSTFPYVLTLTKK